MATPRAKFDQLDEETRAQALSALGSLDATGSGRITIEGKLGQILRSFIQTAVDSGSVAYGPVEAELSPEEASRILGVSRPLVVQRMDDGRLPFHYVGTHRRCRLSDVFALKAEEEKQNRLMRRLYEDLEAGAADDAA